MLLKFLERNNWFCIIIPMLYLGELFYIMPPKRTRMLSSQQPPAKCCTCTALFKQHTASSLNSNPSWGPSKQPSMQRSMRQCSTAPTHNSGDEPLAIVTDHSASAIPQVTIAYHKMLYVNIQLCLPSWQAQFNITKSPFPHNQTLLWLILPLRQRNPVRGLRTATANYSAT